MVMEEMAVVITFISGCCWLHAAFFFSVVVQLSTHLPIQELPHSCHYFFLYLCLSSID